MLRFFFDYVSPYSYLAWTQLHELAARHGRDVEPVPVALGAILSAMGTRGPAEIPAKRAYLVKHTHRLAEAIGVPIVPPPAHPFNSLLALCLSSLPMDAATRRRLVDRLFAAVWVRGEGVVDRQLLAGIAAEVGLPKCALGDAESPETKARLRAQTDEALALGAFGVPTLVVDGELFFGFDSFPHLDAFLRGGARVPAEVVERWANLPVGVERKV